MMGFAEQVLEAFEQVRQGAGALHRLQDQVPTKVFIRTNSASARPVSK